MRTVIDVRLPPDSTAPRLARAALRDLPPALHSLLDTLALMVSELVTNCLIHVDLSPQDRIELVVQNADHHVRVAVKNPGAGYQEALAGWSATRDRVARDKPSLGGYGLSIVAALANRSGVGWDEGTIVWFELDLD